MVFIYIQTIKTGKNTPIPYRLTLKEVNFDTFYTFNFRPEIAITNRVYVQHKLNRTEHINAPLFGDIADDLIELLQDKQLVFSEFNQFKIMKALFKNLGYNFNIQPKYVWGIMNTHSENAIALFLKDYKKLNKHSEAYANVFLEMMSHFFLENVTTNTHSTPTQELYSPIDLTKYTNVAGVYYFLDKSGEILYIGKAKNLRKRLQNHFKTSIKDSNIDYAKVYDINVEYTGNDIIAQLLESAQIKTNRPPYNTQQIENSAPYIINKSKTAKGIYKLQITRKDIKDNLPEIYFNRASVKKVLLQFATEYGLCRKHCGLERVKGPCSNYTKRYQDCVCANTASIESYNAKFEAALLQFNNRKSRRIYKLKGRHNDEDAFVYLINEIYEGYGFINKNEVITNENDIIGHLVPQKNNYDTSRIVENLYKVVKSENIIEY